MASNRSEIFHFLLFCHFGFLQTSLCSSASHLWHQARFPIFTVCFLAQLSGISWKGALFCVVYCVEFWKYFDLHLFILSLCVSSLARQFCFCFCLFSLWWILRRSGGGWRAVPILAYCNAVRGFLMLCCGSCVQSTCEYQIY